jgi:hypothetical protein
VIVVSAHVGSGFLTTVASAKVVSRIIQAVVVAILLGAGPASAQLNGHVSVVLDALPDIDAADGAQSVTELRMRVFAERRDELGPHVRINLAGYVDGLVADRQSISGRGRVSDAIVWPADLYIDIVTPHFDLRAGAARLVWGRLDEFQPTDVVNPIDLSRFVMEGRSEARLPVGLVRARVFLPKSTTLEAVAVPYFRRGRFDQLDEQSSPFNLTRSNGTPEGGARQRVTRVTDEPHTGAESLQGGVRLTSTTARVDWAVSTYRGLRAFPISTVGAEMTSLIVRESFPRFTMIGADFETVRGVWGVRGEVAVFVDDELQSVRAVQGVAGRSLTAGIGVDRKAGDYRVAANALWSWSGVDDALRLADARSGQAASTFEGDPELERSDVSVVLAADRSFSRETRTLRVFAVYDPAEATTFTRVIGAVSVRDNVWIEGSAGVFTGSSLDVIGRLTRRDFAYARLKVFF